MHAKTKRPLAFCSTSGILLPRSWRRPWIHHTIRVDLLLSHRELAAGGRTAGCDDSIFAGDLAAHKAIVVAEDFSADAGKEDPAVFFCAALQVRDSQDLDARVTL